jgi:hypothetical protein
VEVLADPRAHGVGAPVGVEALDVEPEAFRADPQVRVLEPALVVEQGVVHGPERALGGCRLGGAGGRQRARVAALDREVAEGDAQRQRSQPDLDGGAEGALVVAVDDDRRRAVGAADVVVGAERRYRC